MQFNHDNMIGVHLAEDLVNLVAARPDAGADAVENVLADYDFRGPALDNGALRDVFAWTASLRRVFAAASADERYARINELLAAGTKGAYLTTHDGLRPHLHFTPDDDDVASRVRAVTAGGLAIFTVEAEGGRLGECARPGCAVVYIDTSRNGRRAYCSARCGNRVAVQRHRAA